MSNLKVKDIALMAIFTAILFVQEQLLNFIPNVSLTIFLMVLFSKKLGFIKSMIIITSHVLLDNLFMSSFNVVFVGFSLLGYYVIPISLNTVFKKVNNNIILGILGFCFALIYSWAYIIPNVIVLDINVREYMIADILWELTLGLSSMLSIILLYNPMSKLFDNYLTKDNN